jgi:hypothetical protein
VQSLVKAGANKLLRNQNKSAALDIAVARDLPEVVRLLGG